MQPIKYLLLLIAALALVGCSSLEPIKGKPYDLKVHIGTNAAHNLKVLGRLSPAEYQQVGITLRMAADLVPSIKVQQQWGSVPLYWMASTKYDGICHHRDGRPWMVLINVRDRRSTYNNLQRFWFATTVTHELSHFIDGTDDPFTATITDHLLLKVLNQQPLKIIQWNPQPSVSQSSVSPQ